MCNIETLRFDEKGLIPAIVVDAIDHKVLTLAYMNRESLEITMKEGRTCFWSRSRQELWRKGETSGNVQHVVDIVDTGDEGLDKLFLAAELGRGIDRLADRYKQLLILAVPVMVFSNEQEYVIDIDLYLADELGLEDDVVVDILLLADLALSAPFVAAFG